MRRFQLAALPTPLIRAERLQAEVGGRPLYVKRDDLTGFAVAGNKARKLELLIADALDAGADVVMTGGGPGSNHCAATAAAARVAGLACHLVLYGDAGDEFHPNLAMARRFGARVAFTHEIDRGSVDRRLQSAADELRDEGHVPYVVPRGGASAVGAAAYASAFDELSEQLADAHIDSAHVVVAAGSCGTQAGLVAANVASGRALRVVGASVSRPVDECEARVLSLSNQVASLLGTPEIQCSDVNVVDARGPGYGTASREGEAAAGLAARTEGLLLDPVFTAKAFAVALQMLGSEMDGPLVFLHTGGLASALWQLSDVARGGVPVA